MNLIKATLIKKQRIVYPEKAITEIIVWQLPNKSTERPHGYKYRLNYCLHDGKSIVRYDNKSGKDDHKHLYQMEIPYQFISLEKLIEDFNHDVERARKKL